MSKKSKSAVEIHASPDNVVKQWDAETMRLLKDGERRHIAALAKLRLRFADARIVRRAA